MKLTKLLALSLTIVILLALGAIGFADKTEELQNNTPLSGTASPGKANINDHQKNLPKSGSGDKQNNEGDVPGHNMDEM